MVRGKGGKQEVSRNRQAGRLLLGAVPKGEQSPVDQPAASRRFARVAYIDRPHAMRMRAAPWWNLASSPGRIPLVVGEKRIEGGGMRVE